MFMSLNHHFYFVKIIEVFLKSDLKTFSQAARNCLVNQNNVVKVSDFGMTR